MTRWPYGPSKYILPRRTLISCASRPAQIKRILLGSCCCVYGTPPLSIHAQTKQDASLRRVFILQRLKSAVIPTAAAEPNRLTRSKRLLRNSGYGMISFSVTDHMSSLNIVSSSSLLCMAPDSSSKCFDKTVNISSPQSSGSSAMTSIMFLGITFTTLPTQPSHVIEYG